MTELRVVARTDIGTHRKRNEDALIVGSYAAANTRDAQTEQTFSLDEPVLLGVADGIGGHAGGAVASTLVATRLAQLEPRDRDALGSALHALDRELIVMGGELATYHLGTTFCGVLFGSEALAVHVGDGFIAMQVGGELRTYGPSWDDVSETMVLDGALGGRSAGPLTLHWQAVPLVDGGRYVIASDGVIRAVTYETFVTAMRDGQSPGDVLDRIFESALSDRAPDNLTCIVADVSIAP